ncbi:hypothetical protein RD792_017749 [Penstemon davidsonii]|uniref:Peptidase S8/S53 domain-containing protein n=1 Tax=Penstemon davidsonii TaxID=160366 RepID=A0ABR0DW01_9LAMI|nr:hypothetical protein RD792_017749 [Penstemon davidsonii]
MASPHVAGVAALLKGTQSNWSLTTIRSVIMTTTNVLDNMLNPIKENRSNIIVPPMAIGAGHINSNMTLNPTSFTRFEVADFSFRGPSRASSFILKPYVMAPGLQILALR